MNQYNIDNVQRVIQYSMDVNALDKFNALQMNVEGSAAQRELIEFCEPLSELTKLEELKSLYREPTDVSFEDICKAAGSGMAGIKINHDPYMKLHDYEQWAGGYIETFLRTFGHNKPDMFVWQYIRMEHLETILTKFKDNLIFWDNNAKPYMSTE